MEYPSEDHSVVQLRCHLFACEELQKQEEEPVVKVVRMVFANEHEVGEEIQTPHPLLGQFLANAGARVREKIGERKPKRCPKKYFYRTPHVAYTLPENH